MSTNGFLGLVAILRIAARPCILGAGIFRTSVLSFYHILQCLGVALPITSREYPKLPTNGSQFGRRPNGWSRVIAVIGSLDISREFYYTIYLLQFFLYFNPLFL